MGETPVMLVVVVHPDDETFGTGSVIASAAAAGAHVVVCCATRGEAGEDVSGTTTSPAELAAAREEELHAAARVLGAARVVLLDFADSGMEGDMPPTALAAVPIEDVVAAVAPVIDEVGPDIVVTIDPEWINDHRDHMRIGEATTTAFHQVARSGARLYHWTLPRSVMDPWLAEMKAKGLLDAYVDLELGRPDATITTVVDVGHVADTRRAAIAEHRTQFGPFREMSPELEQIALGHDHYVRIVPGWDGGARETSVID
jgi:LmbE family N-acetylglucosaminyl deacetylase